MRVNENRSKVMKSIKMADERRINVALNGKFFEEV